MYVRMRVLLLINHYAYNTGNSRTELISRQLDLTAILEINNRASFMA